MQSQTSERRRTRRDTVIGEPQRPQLEAMIVGSYREMPGLSLHLAQAARLFGLRIARCHVVLTDLVHRSVLRRAGDGQFLRADR